MTSTNLSANRILSIYKSRVTIIDLMKRLDYDVSQYEEFSIHNIDSMFSNNQMDMKLDREKDKHRIYIKYLLNIKQFKKEHLDTMVEDLYEIENVLEKKDTLIVIVNDKPNDTIKSYLIYLFERYNIFIIAFYLKQLQFNILDHTLVPKAFVLTNEEVEEMMVKYNVKVLTQLPEISRFDPHAMAIGLRPNQVIRIERSSDTALVGINYRVCV